MTDHEGCREEVRSGMADLGIEVTVSTAEPIIVGRYQAYGHICPHGTTYWVKPTSEQIAQWHRDGVR